MQYISPNRQYGVLYNTFDGTYEVVQVVGGAGSATWPVVAERDWFKDARERADLLDAGAK